MTPTLHIEADWADMSGVAGPDRPEVVATYANLRVRVGDAVITRAHHRRSGTMIDSVLVSLYPIAEWLTGNWWLLTEEAELPGRAGYTERHSLSAGRDGYCLPDLRFVPEGQSFRLAWAPLAYRHAPLEFVAAGEARVDRREAEDALRDLVERVCGRLAASNIHDSWLQREWNAVQGSEGDADQAAFCRAAAWLGLDPFDIDDAIGQKIQTVARALPAELLEDAFRASRESDLCAMRDWIERQFRDKPSCKPTVPFRSLGLPTARVAGTRPWEVGYHLARSLRAAVPEVADVPTPLEPLFGGRLPLVTVRDAPQTFDGLALFNDGFECRTAKVRPDSQRFLVARALFSYIHLDQPSSLLTMAKTTRQSEGRAFAAELLAPAAFLRDRLDSAWTTQDQMADVANELGVSAYVVEHQVRNHGIASIVEP